jgi:hypothetical protein
MTIITRRQPLQWMLASLLATSLMACGGGDDPGQNMHVDANGVSTFDASALATTLSTYPLQTPSATEADSLSFMREEEELAHAVYAASATRWPALPIFSNIAASETTHTTAVKRCSTATSWPTRWLGCRPARSTRRPSRPCTPISWPPAASAWSKR